MRGLEQKAKAIVWGFNHASQGGVCVRGLALVIDESRDQSINQTRLICCLKDAPPNKGAAIGLKHLFELGADCRIGLPAECGL